MTKQKSRDIHRGFQIYKAGRHTLAASDIATRIGAGVGGTYAAARYISGRQHSAKKFAGRLVGANIGLGPKGRARIGRWFPKTAKRLNRGAEATAGFARKSRLVRKVAGAIVRTGKTFHVERWAPKVLSSSLHLAVAGTLLSAYGKSKIQGNLKHGRRKAS